MVICAQNHRTYKKQINAKIEIKTQGEINNLTCRLFEENLGVNGRLSNKYKESMNIKWSKVDYLVMELEKIKFNSAGERQLQDLIKKLKGEQ